MENLSMFPDQAVHTDWHQNVSVMLAFKKEVGGHFQHLL
jgi:hypothetical protein